MSRKSLQLPPAPTPRPHPFPPDPQAQPRSPYERARAGALAARAAIDVPASATVRRGLRLGSLLGATRSLRTLVHPQWLATFGTEIARRELSFSEPAPLAEKQLELCGRIALAYRAAREHPNDLSPIWKGQVSRYYGVLERALTRGDPLALAEQLRWLFRRPFLTGIATPIDYEDPMLSRYWALSIYDRLVSLAEAVGALRAECPEQGATGLVFARGIDGVPALIESALEISLDHPRVGAPYGVLLDGRLITVQSSVHLHAATCLREAIDTYLCRSPVEDVHSTHMRRPAAEDVHSTHMRRPAAEDVRIVEIGGGFAGAAMWYLRLPHRRAGSYTLIDLPLMNALQAYFLGEVYGAEALELFGEQASGAPIRILPPHALTGPEPIVADVVFNQDSMPEMNAQAARGYLAWMQEHVRGLFLSCNQEAATPVGGLAQLVVAELAAEFDGLTRIARRPSWVRRGYVEEVYRCGGG